MIIVKGKVGFALRVQDKAFQPCLTAKWSGVPTFPRSRVLFEWVLCAGVRCKLQCGEGVFCQRVQEDILVAALFLVSLCALSQEGGPTHKNVGANHTIFSWEPCM